MWHCADAGGAIRKSSSHVCLLLCVARGGGGVSVVVMCHARVDDSPAVLCALDGDIQRQPLTLPNQRVVRADVSRVRVAVGFTGVW